jgi:hypothetical protein
MDGGLCLFDGIHRYLRPSEIDVKFWKLSNIDGVPLSHYRHITINLKAEFFVRYSRLKPVLLSPFKIPIQFGRSANQLMILPEFHFLKDYFDYFLIILNRIIRKWLYYIKVLTFKHGTLGTAVMLSMS